MQTVPLWATAIIAAICSVLSAAIVSMIQRRPAVMTASAAVQEQINAGFKAITEQYETQSKKQTDEVKALRRTVNRLIKHIDKLEVALRTAGAIVPDFDHGDDDEEPWPFDVVLGGKAS